jgi:hypothetical protein
MDACDVGLLCDSSNELAIFAPYNVNFTSIPTELELFTRLATMYEVFLRVFVFFHSLAQATSAGKDLQGLSHHSAQW